MTIRAKYSGTCNKCGGAITVGQKIEWEKGRGASHVTCPEGAETTEPLISLQCGEGYGGRPYPVGRLWVTRTRGQAQQILVIVSASQRYISEEGMSFGVGNERGHVYYAKARQANAEEIAQVVAYDHGTALAEWAERDKDALAAEIREIGECPEGEHSPEGETLFDTQNLYGSGSWFVLGEEHTWYVRNNGMDGDDWSRNNVRTGGAGAIGWRVPTTPELTARLRRIAELIA